MAKPELLILGLILILAALLRFWNVLDLFHWTLDEEYWSYTAHNVATGYHIPLIGGPIGGTGLYLGPLFVWITGVIFWIISSNPFVLAYVMAGLGVVVSALIFLLLRKSLGDKVAGIASLFYASSALVVIYDKKYWNASPIPLLSVLALYLVERLRQRPSQLLSGVLGLVASVAVQSHMSGLAIVGFGLISMLLYRLPRKFVLIYLAVVAASHLPVMAFEVRHDFVNARAFVELVSSEKETRDIPRYDQLVQLPLGTVARILYTPATDIADELTLCAEMAQDRSNPKPVIYLFSALILLFSLWQLKHKNQYALMVAVNFGLIAVYMIVSPENFYPGQLSEYYFLPALVAILILTSQLCWKLWKRVPIIIAAFWLMFLIGNWHIVSNLKHSHSLPQKFKTVQAVIDQVDGQTFHLEVVGHPCQVYGYRYLFTWMGVEPSSDYLGSNFVWLYERRLSQEQAGVVLEVDADEGEIRIMNQE